MVGIGGIGLSALARYFVHIHKIVAGYDRTSSALTSQLINEGISITFDDKPSFTDSAFTDPKKTLIVYTPAVKDDNALLSYFRKGGFHIMKRSEALGQITLNYKTIAIAGTHGKTSVSCLTAHLLHHSAKGCIAILGGIPNNYKTNFILDENPEFAVTEADEFDRSFLKLRPWFAVITSADADHLDIYGDKNSLLESFGEFAANVHPQGVLLVKLDAGLNISSVPVEKVFSYALDNSKADVFAKNIRVNPHFMTFDFIAPETEIKGLEMQSLGLINVENAVAAIFMALNVGVNENEIRAALKSFSGVQRRFQRQYLSDEVVFIDDYAHHPEEIKALVNSVRAIYHGKKITGIFQPHLYSRTRDFADDFAKSLSLLDDIILLEIYPARENPIPDITSEIIFQKIAHSNKSLISKTELPEFLNNKDLQILLTIGAGDIDRLVIPIRQMLEKKHKNQLKS